jgi:hypothetical protein
MSDTTRLLEQIKEVAASRVAGMVPGAVDIETRFVVQEFLSLSQVWKRSIPIPIAAGESEYALTLQSYESAVEIQTARLNNSLMHLWVMENAHTDTGTPVAVGLVSDRRVRVYPTPAAGQTGTINALFVLTLLPDMEVPIPAEVRPYFDTLLAGVLARAYAMVGRGWANLPMAAAMRQKFETDCTSIRVATRTGRGRSLGMSRVAFPPV